MQVMTFAAETMQTSHPPTPQRNWALFLDIDGTLLDIAPTPDAVQVPATLIGSIERASRWLQGALAVVSGRPFSQIDELFAPMKMPGGAGHGAALRLPNGTIKNADEELAVPKAWLATLRNTVDTWPGVVIEEKTHGATVHYRAAPERKEDVHQLVTKLCAQDLESYEALPGRMTFEIRHRTLTKALIVEKLMTQIPVKGRTPVFVGDDVTDEDGFRAVTKLGGIALDVADAFGGQPSAVRAWLKDFAT
jgi:trehalose 6-phosphate phosphatase